MQALQKSAVINAKRTEESAMRLSDWVFVHNFEYLIHHAKFDTVDQLSDWISYNPEVLSYWCGLTSCYHLWAPLPEFVGFRDHLKGMCGLVIERRAKLGTLKSDRVGGRGARVAALEVACD